MADLEISNLPAGGAVSGTDLVAAVQSGTTAKITADQLAAFLSSGSFVAPENVVVVNPDRAVVPGESFQTWTAADVYVQTQTPSVTNRWAIRITGNNSEAIVIRSFVAIVGVKGATRLTGTLTSVVGFTFNLSDSIIIDCIVTNLATTGGFGITGYRCDFEGGTPAGGILCPIDSHVIGGDYSSLAVFKAQGGLISGGTFPSQCIGIMTKVIGINGPVTLNGGEWKNCFIEIDGSDVIADPGKYRIDGGVFGKIGSTFTVLLENDSSFSNVTAGTGAAITLKPDASAILDTQSITSHFIIDTSNGGVTWTNTGDVHDNSVSGLTATNHEAAIVELAGSIAPDSEYFNNTADAILGTANTAIVRFSGAALVDTDTSNSWTIANSPANGWSLTVDIAGTYTFDCSLNTDTGLFGFSINSGQLSTNFDTITLTDRRSLVDITVNRTHSFSMTKKFAVNDVIRIHAVPGAAIANTARCMINVRRVS